MASPPHLQPLYSDPHNYPSGVAFQDGQYLPISQAKVSVLDAGFLHSDATYDVAHVWNGAFFRLDLHLERFFAGMAKLHMAIPYDPPTVREILGNCVSLSGHRSAYVEMICTRGCSPDFSRDPRDAKNRFIAFAVPFASVANARQLADGLHATISDVVRIPPASVDPTVKNYHWLDLVRGLYGAFARGAETVLLCDTQGNVVEGPGFNVFTVHDHRLATPESGALPGITRRTVLDLCQILDLDARKCNLRPDELRAADEVFITSTAGGIMPVSRIDHAPVGDGTPGPITKRLADLYWKMHDHPEWSLPVTYPA